MSIKKYTQMKVFSHFIELIPYCLVLANQMDINLKTVPLFKQEY